MSKTIIRNATLNDLAAVTDLESICFPAAEAAPKQIIKMRLEAYPKGFFVMELDNKIIGFINGGSVDSPTIQDVFFESMEHHRDDGKNLIIFGLDVHPDHQGNGYAKELMDYFIDFSKHENKEAILLTCKDHLLDYYARFGYVNQGVSSSVHGGAKWYDMKLKISS